MIHLDHEKVGGKTNTLIPWGYSLIWLKHLSYIQTTLGSNPSIPTIGV